MRFLCPLPRALSTSHAPGGLTARVQGPQRKSTAAMLQAGLLPTLPAGPQPSQVSIQPCPSEVLDAGGGGCPWLCCSWLDWWDGPCCQAWPCQTHHGEPPPPLAPSSAGGEV